MKKWIAMFLVIVLCMGTVVCHAAGKLNTAQENFYTINSFSTYGYCFAKVENTGDKAIKVNAGVLEIYDANGDVITSTDWISPHAQYLQPGEYTYVSAYGEIEDAKKIAADHMLTLTGKSDNSAVNYRLPCTTDLALDVQGDWWTYNYMYATVTNDTEEPLYGISVVMALLDADGNILCIEDDDLYTDRALMPGSSMIFRQEISSSFMDYFKENNLTLDSVDAIAYVEIEQ